MLVLVLVQADVQLDAAAEGAEAAAAAGAAAAGETLFGREVEAEHLLSLAGRAREGSGSACFVTGDAGIGTSSAAARRVTYQDDRM